METTAIAPFTLSKAHTDIGESFLERVSSFLEARPDLTGYNIRRESYYTNEEVVLRQGKVTCRIQYTIDQ